MKYWVDNKGRFAMPTNDWWARFLWVGLPKEQQFRQTDFYIENLKADANTVLIHRPSGGLGDMVCILPLVEDCLKNYPLAKVVLAFPKNYHWLFEHLVNDKIALVEYKEYHKAGFNDNRDRFRHQFFLWCPAGHHEMSTDYRPTHGRIENFAEVFGVEPREAVLCRI